MTAQRQAHDRAAAQHQVRVKAAVRARRQRQAQVRAAGKVRQQNQEVIVQVRADKPQQAAARREVRPLLHQAVRILRARHQHTAEEVRQEVQAAVLAAAVVQEAVMAEAVQAAAAQEAAVLAEAEHEDKINFKT